MQYFVTSLSVVLPLFLLLAIGYCIRVSKIVSYGALKEMNNVTFRLFIPILLFSNIYHSNLREGVPFKLIGFGIGSLAVMFLFYMLLVPRLERDNAKRGVMVQAICRANFVLFGLPIAVLLDGQGSVGTASLLVGATVPFMNIISVIALESFRGKGLNYKNMIKSILKNPIIIGALLGVLLSLSNIKLPVFIETVLSDIAKIATPLALIILGGTVTFTTVVTNRKQIFFSVANRLVVIPLIGLTIAVLLGFRNTELIVLMTMFASPTAISSYSMAQQMEGNAELAGQLVVFTTAFSIITLFVWVYLIQVLGYI